MLQFQQTLFFLILCGLLGRWCLLLTDLWAVSTLLVPGRNSLPSPGTQAWFQCVLCTTADILQLTGQTWRDKIISGNHRLAPGGASAEEFGMNTNSSLLSESSFIRSNSALVLMDGMVHQW